MKVSREQMAQNRLRILDEAGRLFREKGFDAVSVAEVMKAAGMTHGGFYGHFSSKDDLIARTLEHVMKPGAPSSGDFLDYMSAYLSPEHRDNPASGCPTAGLAAEIRRQSPAARCALTAGMLNQVERMTKAISNTNPQDGRGKAIVNWAAMVGAVVLARAADDPAFSDEVLKEVRERLEAGI